MGRNTAKRSSKPKFHIKKGDVVVIIAGDDKGSQGKVLEINTLKCRALVEGANIVTKHTKPTPDSPEGGIVKQEAGIHISNLKVVDPKTGEATRIGRKRVDGKAVRYAKKSGEEL